jgi:putative ABC transport system ATP-binding protein
MTGAAPAPGAPAASGLEPAPGAGANPAAGPPLVQIDNLSRSYQEGGREHLVLRGASATFGRGQLVVLMGRSGSGKSTLLNLIAGIDLPSQGSVTIDGVPLSRLGERQRTLFRRDHIGFVFQSFNLLPTLTVAENLLLPLELKGSVGRDAAAAAMAILDEVRLADRAASFPDRLSGGEQQRLAVARALIHNPLLVLADEPTGNLDLETGLEVLDLLDRFTRRAGKTMLMVTHSPEVVGIADRVLHIEAGRLVEGTGSGASGAGGGTRGGSQAETAGGPGPRGGG